MKTISRELVDEYNRFNNSREGRRLAKYRRYNASQKGIARVEKYRGTSMGQDVRLASYFRCRSAALAVRIADLTGDPGARTRHEEREKKPGGLMARHGRDGARCAARTTDGQRCTRLTFTRTQWVGHVVMRGGYIPGTAIPSRPLVCTQHQASAGLRAAGR